MQLTRIDRWLRERFVYETHVYTLRAPEQIPTGIIAEQLPDSPGSNYNFRFIARKPNLAEQLISFLRDNNYMFATRVVDRSAWYVPFLAPKDKSLTFWIAWLGISVVSVYGIACAWIAVWRNDEIRENIIDALKVLQG